MSIQSRIESDLSNQPVSSQSRIEQILNGEDIAPRSRIETLLKEGGGGGKYSDVECTRAEYEAMEEHFDMTIYTVTNPDTTVNKYLGDDPIGATGIFAGDVLVGDSDGGVEVSGSRPRIVAVSNAQYTTDRVYTSVWDRSKAWDIIVCVYQDTADRWKSFSGAICGGSYGWPYFAQYPSMEFSSGGLFCGLAKTYDKGWTWTTVIAIATLEEHMAAGDNYLKMSYDGSNLCTIWHSTDCKTWSKLGEIAVTNGTPYTGGTDIKFRIGGVQSNHPLLSPNYHVVTSKCKVYSDGVLIYGSGELLKDFS